MNKNELKAFHESVQIVHQERALLAAKAELGERFKYYEEYDGTDLVFRVIKSVIAAQKSMDASRKEVGGDFFVEGSAAHIAATAFITDCEDAHPLSVTGHNLLEFSAAIAVLENISSLGHIFDLGGEMVASIDSVELIEAVVNNARRGE